MIPKALQERVKTKKSSVDEALLIIILVFAFLVGQNAKAITQPQQLRLISENIFTGIENIAFVQGRDKYVVTIDFPNINQYRTSLYVRDIENYRGPQPIVKQQLRQKSFNPNLKQWGFDFSLETSTEKSKLLIILRIGPGVSFDRFQVGYLISKDPHFIVGHTNVIRQRCNRSCPQVRTWPVSFIIRSPPTGTVFIPFIIGLKAQAPQPSISFTDVADQPLNATHRILHLEMLIQSLHPIQQIIFSYISHAAAQAKYALLIFNGFDPKRKNDDTFYGVVEVNGFIQVSQIQSEPQFFQVIGVALKKAFFLQQDPKLKKTQKIQKQNVSSSALRLLTQKKKKKIAAERNDALRQKK